MTSTAASDIVRDTGDGEQLTLLPTLASSDVSPRFRLSRATRERGLRHVAEIRRMLAERQQATGEQRLPVPQARVHDRAA